MNHKTFTYTICSSTKISGTWRDCIIELPPLPYNYDKYHVVCDNLILETLGQKYNYNHLAVEGWHESGYSLGLPSNRLIINTKVNSQNHSQSWKTHFNIGSMYAPKQYRFIMYGPDLEPDVTSGPNDDSINWFISFQFTPIE
jgi:hypothetical protein